LRVAYAVADFAQILAGIVGTDRIYDHRTVFFYRHSGLQGRDRLDERSVARPPDRHVAGHGLGSTRELDFFTLEFRLVGRRRHDHRSAGYQHPGRVTDLSLSISGDARVVTNVLGPDVRYPQLGAVVDYPYSAGRLHVRRVFEPHDLGRRRADGLAV